MKTMLRISVATNVALLAGMAGIVVFHSNPPQPPVSAATFSTPATTTNPHRRSPQQPPQFQWSDLESTDYRTYIANLRRIGCPEQTIRDIVTADLASLEATRAGQPGAGASSAPPLTATAQTALNELLGSGNRSAENLAPAPQPVEPGRTVREQGRLAKVAMPLVFQNVDVNGLGLSANQIAAIQNVRQQFVDAIGGLNENPGDPGYLEKWQKAQPEADGLLYWALGTAGYQSYQIRAFANSQAAATSTSP